MSSSSPAESAPRRGRPRRADVDRRVESAVLALLRGGGPAAVTMEAVAERAGVAKTTIYRRHDNRADLLRSVLRDAIGDYQELPEGAVREKIRFALAKAWRQMADVLGPGGLSAILMDADPEFTELFRAALRPYDEVLVARIREDSAAGLLRRDVDADGVVDLFLGAYLGALVRHGRVDDDWLDRSLELMWRVLAVPEGED